MMTCPAYAGWEVIPPAVSWLAIGTRPRTFVSSRPHFAPAGRWSGVVPDRPVRIVMVRSNNRILTIVAPGPLLGLVRVNRLAGDQAGGGVAACCRIESVPGEQGISP